MRAGSARARELTSRRPRHGRRTGSGGRGSTAEHREVGRCGGPSRRSRPAGSEARRSARLNQAARADSGFFARIEPLPPEPLPSGTQLKLSGTGATPRAALAPPRLDWALLLRRTFGFDVFTLVTSPVLARQILGLSARSQARPLPYRPAGSRPAQLSTRTLAHRARRSWLGDGSRGAQPVAHKTNPKFFRSRRIPGEGPRSCGRQHPPAGLKAGVVPLALALTARRIGHVCTPEGCLSLCVPMCAVGGLIAGLVLSAAARRSPIPGLTLAGGAIISLAVGTMGCSCVGLGGISGLTLGLAISIGYGFVLRSSP